MIDYSRTHNCIELRKENIEQTVSLSGWVHKRRDHGGLIFIDLRDRYGLTQLVFDPNVNHKAHSLADKMRSEWVITVKGKVIPRKKGMVNTKLKTGEIEIEVKELHILSTAKTPPFSVSDEFIEINEELSLKYRYLGIRRGKITNNLITRHRALMVVRNFLDQQGFLEVTTPILCKSTPEGARDYLVPSRIYPGQFYALPQSPQMFKQLLMISGLDRYFQIATCFRDEDLRADRQPEFSQIDIELSFSYPKDLFEIIEKLLSEVFLACKDINIEGPFLKLTYQECMELYGTDKPDLRFQMQLKTLNEIMKKSTFTIFLEQLSAGKTIKGICVEGGADISRKGIDEYTSFVSKFGIKGLAWMKMQDNKLTSSIVKFFDEGVQKEIIETFNMKNGDLIFMIADEKDKVNQSLDHLRRRLAKDRSLIDPNDYQFLWVTDFPLFAFNAEENRYESEHHPFTSPLIEDIPLMDSDPLKVRSSSYDLVLNGYELASGSKRIHDEIIQEKIFSVLNFSKEEVIKKFGFFINALKYGTPPHLGIAIGFDRLIMVLCGTDNIRDVIAFPKTQKASDLMMETPASVDDEQLELLGIDLVD